MSALHDLTPAKVRSTPTSFPPGSPSPVPATAGPTPIALAPVLDPSADDGQCTPALQSTPVVVGTLSTSGHGNPDAHRSDAAGGTLSTPAMPGPKPIGLTLGSTLPEPPVHSPDDTKPPADGWLELRVWAEMFHDAQQQRIAAVNRAERGGVDPVVYEAYTESLRAAEHVCRLSLRRTMRRVVPAPIRAWQKATPGIGEDLLARLLGHLGDPRWATPHHWEGTGAARVLITDPPFERTVSQLWQYAGHGRPGRVTKGMSAPELAALGSPNLKMLVHLNAEACMKTRTSPYRLVYEQARQDYTDKVHTVECVRCGPSGRPAQVDSPWNPGHQHAAALRKVGKEILRDLWIVSGQ